MEFVPFLYRRPGKLAFLALVASCGTNNLRRINGLNSSTPAASTNPFVLADSHRKFAAIYGCGCDPSQLPVGRTICIVGRAVACALVCR